MTGEFRDDASFQPWGPFISDTYKNEPITKSDIIVASIVWGLTLINVIVAIHLAYGQTRGSRSPLKSVYIWMIWLELFASFVLGLEGFLHLMKLIRPSFVFYFSILFFWCIQVQLLLQIIINRIRIILPDRRRSRMMMVATAVFVTAINISVFNIWLPARLQVNVKYHIINEYWDRIEKCLYLIVDAILNWYFLKTVKANLINSGLPKYKKLVRFNQNIVLVSLLMDVMIIAAMSIPNSFVYIQFHPLAYLVKLNIEMTMANLIKRIAISTSRKTGMAAIAQEFNFSPDSSSTGRRTAQKPEYQRGPVHELASFVSYPTDDPKAHNRVISFTASGNQIKETHEVIVRNEPNETFEKRGSEVEITGGYTRGRGLVVMERGLAVRKSMDSIMEGNESLKSLETRKRGLEDSDDEAALVGQMTRGWVRKAG